MVRRGYENLKCLIVDKESRIDGLYLFITISMLLFLAVNIFAITYRHGIIGFLVITSLCVFFVLVEFLILSVTRNKKLVAALLFLSVLPQVNFLTLSTYTVSYCMEPSHPYWDTDIGGTPPRKYNGVPFYMKGYNPCNIPDEYLYQDHRLRKKYDESGFLLDWFK